MSENTVGIKTKFHLNISCKDVEPEEGLFEKSDIDFEILKPNSLLVQAFLNICGFDFRDF